MAEANGAVEEIKKKKEEQEEEMPYYNNMQTSLEKCPVGYTWVPAYKRKGNTYVKGHCMKMHRLHL